MKLGSWGCWREEDSPGACGGSHQLLGKEGPLCQNWRKVGGVSGLGVQWNFLCFNPKAVGPLGREDGGSVMSGGLLA